MSNKHLLCMRAANSAVTRPEPGGSLHVIHAKAYKSLQKCRHKLFQECASLASLPIMNLLCGVNPPFLRHSNYPLLWPLTTSIKGRRVLVEAKRKSTLVPHHGQVQYGQQHNRCHDPSWSLNNFLCLTC